MSLRQSGDRFCFTPAVYTEVRKAEKIESFFAPTNTRRILRHEVRYNLFFICTFVFLIMG